MIRKLGNFLIALLPAIVFLGFWEWYVSGDPKLQFLFASPSMIADVALAEWPQAAIWHNTFITFSEAALGLIGGTILGTALGLILWGNGRIDFITRPYLTFIGAIPIFAIAPITIMWFGIGLLSKAIMAGFAVFFVSLVQAYEGAHIVAKQHLGFARSIGAPNGRIIRKIIIPGTFNWVIAGYRMNVGFALMGAFVGEFISSEAGLGHYILKTSSLYDMPKVLFGLFMLSVLGLLMTAAAWLARNWRHN